MVIDAGQERNFGAQGRTRGRECHGDPRQRLGNMDRGRIRPAAVRSRPLSYHQGDWRRIAARNRRNRRDGQWGYLAEWLGRNRPHPARGDPQEPRGTPPIKSLWSASTGGPGCPGLPTQLRHLPTAIEGTDGRLWFAVNSGVVSLDPTRASYRIPSPPVSIQSVTADDKIYEMDQRPDFPAGTSNIQINYAAVSLLHPEAIRFRYKLQEMDDEWHEAARSTSVNYRNLAPGYLSLSGRRERCQRPMVGQAGNGRIHHPAGVLPDELVSCSLRHGAVASGMGGLPGTRPAVESSVRDDAGRACCRAHAHCARPARHAAAELPRAAAAVPDRVQPSAGSSGRIEAGPCERHRPGGRGDHRGSRRGARTAGLGHGDE